MQKMNWFVKYLTFTFQGYNALEVSVTNGHMEIVSFLYPLYSADDALSAFSKALAHRKFKIALWFLKHGVNINTKDTEV